MVEKKNKLEVTLPSDTEIKQVREFDAPRELVFRAYTDPETIPHWWGPHGYTTKVDKMDVRPGGAWRFIQHDPEGNEFAFRGEYREVQPPERLVGTFEFEPWAGSIAVESTTFEDLGGRTRMVSIMSFDTKKERDGMFEAGMEEGAAQGLDRFEELLSTLQEEAK